MRVVVHLQKAEPVQVMEVLAVVVDVVVGRQLLVALAAWVVVEGGRTQVVVVALRGA